MQQKGYNSAISSNGNSTAQKFGYNGIELEEALGVNLHEMGVRSYDAAIGRFTGIDPVTHYDFSTYTAFDNNPIYWADPSGANASLAQATLGLKPFDAGLKAKAGFQTSGVSVLKDAAKGKGKGEDHITNNSKAELEAISGDLNRIYKDKYGETPFSVEKETRTHKVKVKDGGWFGDDEYKDVKKDIYVLKGSVAFDWNKDKYTKSLYAIMTSSEDILVDIIPNNGLKYHSRVRSAGYNTTDHGFMSDYQGGITTTTNEVLLSVALSYYNSKNSGDWTVGGVTIHELLKHISPDADDNEHVNVLRDYYNVRANGSDHLKGKNINTKIKN